MNKVFKYFILILLFVLLLPVFYNIDLFHIFDEWGILA